MRTHKFAWARLNSDALFLALLVIASEVYTLIDPSRDDALVQVGLDGHPTPLFYLKSFAYLLGGISLLYSLLRANIKVEVFGRVILCVSLLVDVVREGIAFSSFTDSHVQATLAFFIFLAGTTVLRITALFNRDGLVFELPPRYLEEVESNDDS